MSRIGGALLVVRFIGVTAATILIVCGAPRTVRGYPWAAGGEAPRRVHGFVAGGFQLQTTRSLVKVPLLAGWNLTSGLETPVSSTWTLVPRAHLSGANGGSAGALHWTRLALDARHSESTSYEEAGFGMSVRDFRRVVSGAPFFQVVLGLRGNPDQAVSGVAELITAISLDAEHTGGLEFIVGVEF